MSSTDRLLNLPHRVRYRLKDAPEWADWQEKEFSHFDSADDFAGLMSEWYDVKIDRWELASGDWKRLQR